MSGGAEPVAVVGLACRTPGGADYEDFWGNLVAGVESVRHHTVEEMVAAGVEPAEADDPEYVRATAFAADLDGFDAPLFGLTPRDAEVCDPQHRLFMECAHSALSDAGYDAFGLPGPVGVFGGSSPSEYAELFVRQNRRVAEVVGEMTISVSNDADYLATLTSYRLGFTGPSVNVQTACSTALVAVHLACQSLRAGECEIALAGGANVQPPWEHGYWFQEGSILSRSGHVRPFDSGADGTIFSAGGGVVALKLLSAALRDGDHVYAVIRGSAVNNDGSLRAGFTAPGPDGQAAVVAAVMAGAGVDADSVGYVEAHGTGTAVGDPIEIAALTRAYRAQTDRVGYCAIGSVKGNVGHLGAAAGVIGLIKAALALDRELIPPSINYERSNPAITLGETPFTINTTALAWPRNGQRRHAAVSSFGIGGTNAHVLLEEAPATHPADPPGRRHQVLPVSARTEGALAESCSRLAAHLDTHQHLDLADVAMTLQDGRGALPFRQAVVAADAAGAAAALRGSAGRPRAGRGRASSRVAFLFPGQGAQYAGMGAGLYQGERVYREALDRCAEALRPELGLDLRDLLHATGPDADAALARTAITQPALFAVEWALAELWASLSVEPAAMLGHSVGEYVAATRSGVFTLEDGLRLIAARGRLMQACEPGAMLAVPLGRDAAEELAGGQVSVAASNAPRSTVLSGPEAAIEAVAAELARQGVEGRRLTTSHAFHSSLVEPAMRPFAELVAGVERRPPTVPYVSNLTGDWATAELVCEPWYWARHLRSEVRCSAGLRCLLGDGDLAFLEVGPGRALATFVREHVAAEDGQRTCAGSLRHPSQRQDDTATLLAALGALWSDGVAVDWARARGAGRRSRVPLPGYPYERRRHWVEPDPAPAVAAAARDEPSASPLEAPLWVPVWNERPARARGRPAGETWLLVADPDQPFGAALATEAAATGATVVVAAAGYAFDEGYEGFTIDPESPDDHLRLLEALADTGRWPDRIVHALCPVAGDPLGPTDRARLDREVRHGFMSLLALLQAIARRPSGEGCQLLVVTDSMQRVLGTEDIAPGQASVLGAVLSVDKELPQVASRSIDVVLAAGPLAETARAVVAEAALDDVEQQVALRDRRRWALDFAPVEQEQDAGGALRPEGVYLITGGLGDLGLEVAHDFARRARARLALLGRRRLPPRDRWEAAIAAGDEHAPTLRRLLEIEQAGAELAIHAVDVADPVAVAEAVASVRARFGALHGVVHAAGLPGGGMLAVRRREDAEEVFAAKVLGTAALLDACGDGLDFFASFSSILAVAAELGQADYTGANAVLDRFAHRMAGSPTQHIAIDWTGWSGMGMLRSVAEVIDQATAAPAPAHPLLRTVDRREDRIRSTVRLQPGAMWPIDEHRFGDLRVVPATLYLELARATLEAGTGQPAGEFEDVLFAAPLMVPDPLDCELELRLQDDGWWQFTFGPARAGTDQARAVGRIRPVTDVPPRSVDLAELRASCPRPITLGPDTMGYGLHWDAVVGLTRDAAGSTSLLELALPDGCDTDLGDYWLHPALLDRGTSTGTPVLDEDDSYLPFTYRRLVVHRPIPGRCVAVQRHEPAAAGDEWLRNDVLIVDQDGTVCVEIEGFTLRHVAAADRAAVQAGPAGPVDLRTWLDDTLTWWAAIEPAEGVELLQRVLASRPGPQVVICPEGMPAYLAKASQQRDVIIEDLVAGTSGASSERDLSTPLVAPATDLEALLATLWGEALGLREVGVEDDFFDLGGSSLVAVQILARLRDRLGVDIPIAIVFESSTVRQLAARLEAQLVELVTGMSDEAVEQALEASP